jgi:hypothetical protein
MNTEKDLKKFITLFDKKTLRKLSEDKPLLGVQWSLPVEVIDPTSDWKNLVKYRLKPPISYHGLRKFKVMCKNRLVYDLYRRDRKCLYLIHLEDPTSIMKFDKIQTFKGSSVYPFSIYLLINFARFNKFRKINSEIVPAIWKHLEDPNSELELTISLFKKDPSSDPNMINISIF